jgi:2-iminoacetate synthase ThiH
MTPLVSRALAQAGLLEALEARESGGRARLEDLRPVLEAADWLLLGALANEIREREVGRDVRVFANSSPDTDSAARDFVGEPSDGGIPFLRRVALDRIFSTPAARVRVGWDGLGMEFAQVTLAFGASELFGAVRFKDGELVTVDALLGHGKRSKLEPAQVVKRREVARFLTRAGRRALFATPEGTFEEYTEEATGAEHTATSPTEISLP